MLHILITLFISLYLIHFFWDTWLSNLNIKHMLKFKKSPPPPFSQYIDKENYQKSIEYTTTYNKFNLISSTISSIFFLTFIYSGLMNTLDMEIQSHIQSNIWRGIIFFITLYFIFFFLGLPFSLYSTFVIEEKFGFNKETPKLWVIDQIKGIILTLILMLPISYIILYFMENTGTYWWIYTWLAFFIYGLTLAQIYPVFIAPIFNTFTPIEDGELKKTLQTLSQKANFPLEGMYIMDASKRSTHSNAYFTGFGKSKRLVLYDSLVEKFETEEIAAVVAHEIGHFRKKHIWKQLIFSQTTALLFFCFLSFAIKNSYLYQVFFIKSQSLYMGIILAGFITSLAMSFFSPLSNMISWRFEKEADKFAFDILENKEAIKTMLIKIAEKNFSNLTPHPLYAKFYYSHPPILQRLKTLHLDT